MIDHSKLKSLESENDGDCVQGNTDVTAVDKDALISKLYIALTALYEAAGYNRYMICRDALKAAKDAGYPK